MLASGGTVYQIVELELSSLRGLGTSGYDCWGLHGGSSSEESDSDEGSI